MKNFLNSLSQNEKIALTVAFSLLALAILFFLGILLSKFIPALSHSYRKLKKYGNPKKLRRASQKEIKENLIWKNDHLCLTPKYLVDQTDEWGIIPLESVLWVFTMHFMHYRPRSKKNEMRYQLEIVTITGDSYLIDRCSSEDVRRIRAELEERYPNFFYGFSKEHEEMVNYIVAENKKELKELKRSARK